MAGMDLRFVIQLHATDEGEHYDFMLETEGALATWRLPRPPGELGADESIAAEALGDHRLAYLTYQGPVSGDRGTVRIVDAGRCRILARSSVFWRVQLAGRRARGVFILRREADDHWRLSRASQPAQRAE